MLPFELLWQKIIADWSRIKVIKFNKLSGIKSKLNFHKTNLSEWPSNLLSIIKILTITSNVEPLKSAFNKCTSSIRNIETASISLLFSIHLLVNTSHFSGVEIMILYCKSALRSTSSLSLVTEIQFTPKPENFLCQSTSRSSHRAFIGETKCEGKTKAI